jgi:hypothetical protein
MNDFLQSLFPTNPTTTDVGLALLLGLLIGLAMGVLFAAGVMRQ